MGTNLRNIHVNTIFEKLGERKSKSLLMFHALTGCDTVAHFKWKGKKKCWETWEEFDSVSEAFLFVLENPFVLIDEDGAMFKILEKYVIQLYDRSKTFVGLGEARKFLFCKKTRSLDRIPPTQVYMHDISVKN